MKVNNKYLSSIFNIFDFPIRFIYCRCGLISLFLNRIMFWKFYTSDFEMVGRDFEKIMRILDECNITIKNKTVLELGPGNSHINAYNFLMEGAKKIILVDKFPRYIKTRKQQKFFLNELEFIKKKYNQKSLFFIKKNEVDENFINLINKEITEINLKNQVDFIFSNSVLEHIKDIEINIQSFYRILKAGGYMLHSIDLRDHYNSNNPFLFYKYSDHIWNRYLTKEGLSYTNRLRYDDFVYLFKRTGFKLISQTKTEYKTDGIKLNNKFLDKPMESLKITTLKILLRK